MDCKYGTRAWPASVTLVGQSCTVAFYSPTAAVTWSDGTLTPSFLSPCNNSSFSQIREDSGLCPYEVAGSGLGEEPAGREGLPRVQNMCPREGGPDDRNNLSPLSFQKKPN